MYILLYIYISFSQVGKKEHTKNKSTFFLKTKQQVFLKTKPLKTKPLKTKPLKTKPLKTKPLKTKPLKTRPFLKTKQQLDIYIYIYYSYMLEKRTYER